MFVELVVCYNVEGMSFLIVRFCISNPDIVHDSESWSLFHRWAVRCDKHCVGCHMDIIL